MLWSRYGGFAPRERSDRNGWSLQEYFYNLFYFGYEL
jgi:hypothetical protein